jgi:hypothetical protein
MTVDVFPKSQRHFQLAMVRNVRTGAYAHFLVNEDPESRRDWKPSCPQQLKQARRKYCKTGWMELLL